MKRIARLRKDMREIEGPLARKVSAATLNDLARGTRDLARHRIGQQFTLRKGSAAYARRGIVSTRVRSSVPMDAQETRTGTSNYMARQETGGQLPFTSGRKRRLTTAQGADGVDQAFPRQKNARGKLRPGRMKIERPIKTKGMTRQQRMVVTVKRAARRRGRALVWMRLAGRNREGVFSVTGSKDNPRVRMVHAVYRTKLRVKPSPWLEPSQKAMVPNAPIVAGRNLLRAIERRRLLK